jgi:TPR repeat protein
LGKFSATHPVPEPETYALLLAGLAVVGAADGGSFGLIVGKALRSHCRFNILACNNAMNSMRHWRLLVFILAFASGQVMAGPLDDADAAIKREDYPTAMQIYRQLAERGNAEAQFSLGSMYGVNISGIHDPVKMVYWIRKAANQGIVNAQYALGNIFQHGDGVPVDYQQAWYWHRRAADNGSMYAKRELGVMYIRGNGVPKDDKQAFYWFQMAADQGNETAQYDLDMLFNGGVPKVTNRLTGTISRPIRATLADKINAAAQNNLGVTSANVQAEPKNEGSQAVNQQPTAADQGNDDASSQSGSFSVWQWLVLLIGAIPIRFAVVYLLKKRLARGANEASPNILFWRSLNFPAVVFYLLALYLLAKSVGFSLYGLWLTLTDVVLLSTFLGVAIGVSLPGAVFHYIHYRSLRSATSSTQNKPEDTPHTSRQGRPADDALWDKAMSEYDSPERQKGLYARLFAQEDGDESRVKAQYLKERVDQLRGGR